MKGRWLRGILVVFGMVGLGRLAAYSSDLAEHSGALDFMQLAIGLAGGLALFLFGMDRMSDALQHAAGSQIKTILAKLTTNRVRGLLTGAAVTAVIQSSSVTTVMVVGFIAAGLMTLRQSLAVILGADVGTTITAQIVAFKVTHFALLFVGLGYVMSLRRRDERTAELGHTIMGLGLIFHGMGVMSAAMEPLRSFTPFLELMARMSNPWLGVAAGAAFTALIQSSSATMGVVIMLASQGVITLEAGIALALGANIGTCATAGLASLGKPPEAVRAALAHVLFKVIGVLIAAPALPYLADLATAISPTAPAGLSPAAALAAEVPRQVANAHTVLNLAIAFVFFPVLGPFAKLVEKLVPDRPTPHEEPLAATPRYLDRTLLGTPVLATGLVRREVGRVGDRLETMLALFPDAAFGGDLAAAREAVSLDDEVDALYTSIAAYLTELGKGSLNERGSDEVMAMLTTITELESIGDVMENKLVHYAQLRANSPLDAEPEVKAALEDMHALVNRAVRLALVSFVSDNIESARLVTEMKQEVNQHEARIRAQHALWLQVDVSSERLRHYSLNLDQMESLRRVYYHAKRVAKMVLQEDGVAAWATDDEV